MNPGVQLRIQVCVATRLLRVTTTVPALAEIRLGIPEKVSSADVDFNVSQRRPVTDELTIQLEKTMPTLLAVNSSPRSNSVSRRLTRHLTEQWKQRNPGGRVIERDLAAEMPAGVSDLWIQGATTPEAQRTPEQRQALKQSDEFIAELMAADVIVIGAPMHNFSIPTALKAWIDQIVRAGKTFNYTDKGPKGLLPADKRVLVIASRGGAYNEGSPADFQVPYLRHMLQFVGLSNLTVVDADKQAFGPEAAEKSVEAAIQKLSQYHEHLAVSA